MKPPIFIPKKPQNATRLRMRTAAAIYYNNDITPTYKMAVLKYKGANGEWIAVNGYKVNNVIVSQEKGQSTAEVMSQKAVTDEISRIDLDINEINNTLGDVATNDALGELENVVSLKANKTEVYTKTESDGKYQSKGNYLTAHQDISGKANKADVYAKTETYSKTEVDNLIAELDVIDCGEY